jgi:hypothetical protein
MFDLRMLSTEERAEYDQIVYDAIHDGNGEVRPTAEFGSRFRQGLEHAESIGRTWPRWLMDEMVDTGLQRRAKEWLKAQEFVSISNGKSGIITKAARIGVLRRFGASSGYQQVLWSELTVDDLIEVVESASKRRRAEAVNISTARRLLALCRTHHVSTVGEALDLEGASLNEFLGRSA